MSVIESAEVRPESPSAPPKQVEVRRNAGLAALLGVASAALAIAYLARAVRTAAPLDWALVAVMALLAVVWLRTFVDARTPLLVADAQGIRLRLGRTWRGLPWTEVRDVLLRPRGGLLRDGRLTVEPFDYDRVLADLDPAGRRQARWATRLYGAPLAVPLGLTTRVVGARGDLGAALRELAVGVSVVELVPVAVEDVEDAEDAGVSALPVEEGGHPRLETEAPDVDAPDIEVADGPGPRRLDPRPRLAAAIGSVAGLLRLPRGHRGEVDESDGDTSDTDDTGDTGAPTDLGQGDDPAGRPAAVLDDAEAGPFDEAHEWGEVEHTRPVPVRALRRGRRSETTSRLAPRGHSDPGDEPADEPVDEPVDDLADRAVDEPGDRVVDQPPATASDAGVVDDLASRRVLDPVIGPQLAAARRRLALGVDQLAERTRIRPHVIEAIEVDDFGPCGGDFYARGHLRTLARVLGVEAAPLLVDYDERYADAPIDPRKVFEAELATAAQRRSTAGPNWTLLVGAVMALVLAWSLARLFLDQPTELRGEAPVFRPAAVAQPATLIGEPVTVKLTATRPSHVVVRNAEGRTVFTVDLTADQPRSVRVVPPVRVTASHGNAVSVTVAGVDHGLVGDSIRQTTRRFQVDG